MKLDVTLKRLLLVISSAGIAFSAMIILFLTAILPVRGSYEKLLSPVDNRTSQNQIGNMPAEPVVLFEQTGLGLPVRLKIPKIKIDTVVEYVGFTSDGAMDVPKSQSNVAWFNLGQRPGESGSAVMAGHYGRIKGTGSVFDNLHKLRKGDKVYVEDDEGAVITFVVRELIRFDPKADASGVFTSNDGESHLNLVTCDGIWNKIFKSYSKRLVVFTDKQIE